MTSWHIDDAALRDWIEHRETADQAASVELHLVACEECRERVRDAHLHGGGDRDPALDLGVGAGSPVAIQIPRPLLVERGLCRLGLPAADARLVAAADVFRGPWLMGVLAVLAFVVLAAEFGRSAGHTAFLVVAPMLPSVAVALSYDPALEPALEQELVTPYPWVRLVLLRTIAVLSLGAPVVLVISPFAPGGVPFLWLLPAVGFVAAVLALSTWTEPLRAVGAVGVIWLTVVLASDYTTSAVAYCTAQYPITYLAVAGVSIGVFALIICTCANYEPEGADCDRHHRDRRRGAPLWQHLVLRDANLRPRRRCDWPARPERGRQDDPAAGPGNRADADRDVGPARPRPGGARPADPDPPPPGLPAARGTRLSPRVHRVRVRRLRRRAEGMDSPGTRHDEVHRALDVVDQTDSADQADPRAVGDSGDVSVWRRRCSAHQDPRTRRADHWSGSRATGDLAHRVGRGRRAPALSCSTHQTEDLAALCERVVLLEAARILYDGTVVVFVGQAAGRVWLAAEPDPRARASWRTGTGQYRNIAAGARGAQLVEPSLEDAYLLLRGGSPEPEPTQGVAS